MVEVRTYDNTALILSSELFRNQRDNNLAFTTLLFILFVLCTSPAFSQTVWFEYDGNPVLDVGPPGIFARFVQLLLKNPSEIECAGSAHVG